MKKIIKQYIIPMILSILMGLTIRFWLYGIPLIGLPEKDDVSYVEITNTNYANDIRILTDYGDIEKATIIPIILKCKLGMPKQEAPLITIVYHLKNGVEVRILANKDTVYWRGKAYAIKDNKGTIFVNVTEGLFFSD